MMTTMPCNWLSLPNEKLWQVFFHLEDQDLLTLATVCSLWKKVSEDDALWKEIALKKIPSLCPPPLGGSWKIYYKWNLASLAPFKCEVYKEEIFLAWGNLLARCKWPPYAPELTLERTTTEKQGMITSFFFRKVGILQELITGSADNCIRTWCYLPKEKKYHLQSTLIGHKRPVTQIIAHHAHLVTCDHSGFLYLWQKKHLVPTHYSRSCIERAHDLAITQICQDTTCVNLSFITSSKDATVKAWRLAQNELKLEQTLLTNENETFAIDFNSENKTLALGSSSGSLSIWKKGNDWQFRKIQALNVHHATITCLQWTQNGHSLISTDGHCIKVFRHEADDTTLEKTYFANRSSKIICLRPAYEPNSEQFSRIVAISRSEMIMLSLAANRQKRISYLSITDEIEQNEHTRCPLLWQTIGVEQKNFKG